MNNYIEKSIINHINQNIFYNNNLYNNNINLKGNFFLEKKRRLHPLSSFNKLSEERQYDFFFPKPCGLDKEKNIIPQYNNEMNLLEESNKINGLNENKKMYINYNYMIYPKLPKNNFIEFLNQSENKNKINNYQGNFVNNNIDNFNNRTENELINIYPNLNENKIRINNETMDNENHMIISQNNMQNDFDMVKNQNKTIKKNIFNVTYINDENDNNINRYNNTNNNEVRVLKNNKIVYVNSSLLNSYYNYTNLKFVDKGYKPKRSKRSSKYRGVSKNGNQWQVLIMLDKNKSYIRSYSSEYIAARIYDILAIKKKGYKARTNFIYDSEQINKIIKMDIDIKAKNINEIISNLFK